MENSTLPDDPDFVNSSEIRWSLEPPDLLDDVDLLTLDDHELLEYARDLKAETRWLRRLLREALRMLHVVTQQLDAARALIRTLRRQERTR